MTEAIAEDDLRMLAASIVAQCAGFVSMCWEPRPDGVFRSELANVGVDRALDELFTTFNITLKESPND